MINQIQLIATNANYGKTIKLTELKSLENLRIGLRTHSFDLSAIRRFNEILCFI